MCGDRKNSLAEYYGCREFVVLAVGRLGGMVPTNCCSRSEAGCAMPYRRILLKLSGEVLGGPSGVRLDPEAVQAYAAQVSEVAKSGVQVGVVLGGGNFWRGRMAPHMDRTSADSMGMLATVMNGLAFADALRHLGTPAIVQTATAMPEYAERFSRVQAIAHLEQGTVVIFAGGTGNPYFTTDSAAALRALQIDADVVLKGTMVDGVYDADPHKNPDAKRFSSLSYTEVLRRNLKVMDAAAISLCMDNGLPIVVFDIVTPGNLWKMVSGSNIGTVVKEDA